MDPEANWRVEVKFREIIGTSRVKPVDASESESASGLAVVQLGKPAVSY